MKTINLNKYKLDIIDNPELVLSERDKINIIDQCVIVARESFGNETITKNDVYIHSIKATTAIYVRDNLDYGKIIGFGSSAPEYIDENLMIHLKGSAVLPNHQKNDLYKIILPTRLILESKKLKTPDFFCGSRTQNPRVFQTMTKRLGMFPQIGLETDEEIKDLAERYAIIIQEKHSDFVPKGGVKFDRDSMVVRRAYGG